MDIQKGISYHLLNYLMNAPSLKCPADSNVVERVSKTVDADVRSYVTGLWLQILATLYRDLMKKVHAVVGYSESTLDATKKQCQTDFAACPEYGYILACGSPSQQAQAKVLLDSLAVTPQRVSFVEPVVLSWPSVNELRNRVIAALK